MSDTQTALRGAALATAGLAAASLLSAKSAQAATTGTPVTLYFTTSPSTGALQVPGTGDTQVLNFALALETLEAELYRQALARLTTGGTDMFGQTITGLNLAANQQDVKYIAQFALIENQHRDFLTAALKGNWVTAAKAKFDFGIADTNNFGTAPLNRLQTVQLVYAAEQTGVSAYLGGAGALTPGSTNLTFAAAILGTEARHTTAVAIVLNAPPLNETPKLATAPLVGDAGILGSKGTDVPLTPDQVLNTGGAVAPDTTVAGDGKINPVSGPKGFGGKGFVFV
jgi:hypothetical protein